MTYLRLIVIFGVGFTLLVRAETSESILPTSSFFGFGREAVPGIPQPDMTSPPSCQSCQSQPLDSLELALPSQPQIAAPKSNMAVLGTELLVFISLSMPEASLKQLAFEAQQMGARLILQGLVENSFQKTLPKLQSLQLSLEIDPTLFELFDIKRVPTFVRCRTSSEGPILAGHDRLTGNISLQAALEQFKALGELS